MAYQDLRRNGRLYGEYDPERHLLRIKRNGDSEPQIFDLSQYRPPLLPLVVREGGESEHMGAPNYVQVPPDFGPIKIIASEP